MKKLLSLCSFVLLCTALSAQQIPNGSFKYWSSYYSPDGWGTWASAVSPHNSVAADSLAKLAVRDTMSGDYITDSSTLKLTVDTTTLPSQGHVTLAGFASLGGAFYVAPPFGVGLQYGYMPYAQKPDTLYTDYKFTPATGYNDTALIVISLTKWDTLSHIRWQVLSLAIPLAATAQWQRNVAFPLRAYYNTSFPDSLQPDSMQIIIFSSVSVAPSLGTTLWIDSLHFDASVNPISTGMPDIPRVQGIAIYPNPADDKVHIVIAEKETGSGFKMFNSSGQLVHDGHLDKQSSMIDTRDLPAGIYTLRISSRDHLTVYKSSFCIAR
ncbi:MAG: hypothetical protein JWO03_3889 [Bacteroidetes bacterium]|nr:hypothetical protein [Bacteroidota bacterium]